MAWNDATAQAFEKIKESLADVAMLAHPKFNAASFVMVDASDTAVGAVFKQIVNAAWQAILFFLMQLTPAECCHSTFGRELLVYLAIKHIRQFLEDIAFHILTDHKPLTYALTSSSFAYTPREIGHMASISGFTNIRFINGNVNTAANALSRIPVRVCSMIRPSDDFLDLTAAQLADPELQQLHSGSASLIFKD